MGTPLRADNCRLSIASTANAGRPPLGRTAGTRLAESPTEAGRSRRLAILLSSISSRSRSSDQAGMFALTPVEAADQLADVEALAGFTASEQMSSNREEMRTRRCRLRRRLAGRCTTRVRR